MRAVMRNLGPNRLGVVRPTELHGRSRAVQRLRARIDALSVLRVPVLFHGEIGSGRTHCASLLLASAPGNASELCVESGDLEPSRLARLSPRKTLLIREVDSLVPSDQSRCLEMIRRSAGEHPESPRRVLATASRPLAQLASEGAFDPALAHELGRFILEVPPLRERAEDVSPLALALAESDARRLRGQGVSLTPGALALLSAQPWPGNVQELADVVERLVAFCPGDRITRDQVKMLLDEDPRGVSSSRRHELQRQREELAELITQTGGNLAEVARRLDMSRGGVIYRAQKFGLLPRRA